MNVDLRDVRFECFSGHGPGGQNRNKCQNCVRAIHVPTGIVATATSERSMRQNKAMAIGNLASKIQGAIDTHNQAMARKRRDEKPEAAFGAQIRTYRRCGSDQGVVDHRTGATAGIDALTRGRIDRLIEANLRREITS